MNIIEDFSTISFQRRLTDESGIPYVDSRNEEELNVILFIHGTIWTNIPRFSDTRSDKWGD